MNEPFRADIVPLSGHELAPFRPLLAEIECGAHFCPDDPTHSAWLDTQINRHLSRGARFYGITDPSTKRAIAVLSVTVSEKLFCPPTAEVLDIGVVDEYRRCGYGTRLLQYAIHVSEHAGASALFARTYAADADAIAFYGRVGFVPVAVIPGTNGPNDEGDIVMRLKLSKASPGEPLPREERT